MTVTDASATLAGVQDPGRPTRGWFITIEGPEGAGKTTQAERARRRISAAAASTSILTREPGGTWLGERLREVAAGADRLRRPDRPADRCPPVQRRAAPARRARSSGRRSTPGRRSSAPASPTRRSPTRATAPACRSSGCARSPTVATDGLAARPDDPARPARRGRPRAQGARRRDPLRGRVRPGLPPTRPGRLPGARRGRAGALRGRRCDPAAPRRWPTRCRPPSVDRADRRR